MLGLHKTDAMGKAVDRFEVLVRHGALCSRLNIDQLVDAYKAMEPALHRYCNRPDVVDIEALLYASDRLPKTIYQVKEILIQADAPDKLPSMAGIVRVSTGARRRLTYQVGNDVLIVVAREGRTELLDLITLLCIYQIEAQKIASLLSQSALLSELRELLQDPHQTLEARTRLLARLAFDLGTTDDLMVELDKDWDGELLERLLYLTSQPPNYLARLHRDYSMEASTTRAKKWASRLKRGVESLEKGQGPVHILSSNTHSTVNLLSGYALQVQDEIWQWAHNHSEHREYLEQVGERTPNLTYFLLRDWLKAFPERKAEKEQWERETGVLHLPDEHYTGVHSQIIHLERLNPACSDPRLKEYLLNLKTTGAVLLNFDYAFGEQAGILVEQLFRVFQDRIASFSIMGKAGTVVGGRGGVMLPNYLLREGTRDVYDLPFGNGLAAEDLSDLNLGEVYSGGPMLTVAGTVMQNEKMLRRYRDEWNILGLEMEGIPYIRALQQCLKRGWVSQDLDVLVGYYASDAPLEVGETLARELAFEGLGPTYGLNIAILRSILRCDAVMTETQEEFSSILQKKEAQEKLT